MHAAATILRLLMLVAFVLATPAAAAPAMGAGPTAASAAADGADGLGMPCDMGECDEGGADRRGCHPSTGCASGFLAVLAGVPSLPAGASTEDGTPDAVVRTVPMRSVEPPPPRPTI